MKVEGNEVKSMKHMEALGLKAAAQKYPWKSLKWFIIHSPCHSQSCLKCAGPSQVPEVHSDEASYAAQCCSLGDVSKRSLTEELKVPDLLSHLQLEHLLEYFLP